MSKNVALFVDVANLYYSARGQDVDVDYVALLKYATKGRDLIRAYAYSGLDPENENQRKFIDFLGKNGYKVITKDIRKFGDGRVKANLDIELVVDLFRVAHRMDIAVIVSGDGDFAPAIVALQESGVRCEVISFRPNTSSDLMAVADAFVDVMKIAGIGRGSKEPASRTKRMSMPEMPAKEVNPEFGFRDASPSVAAAALAAIREGKDGRSGSSRGRGGRSRSKAGGTAEPPERGAAGPVVSEAEASATGEGRRRRRRRGGRGRGRGRGHTAAAVGASAPAGDGEAGWTDDVSQLDELAFSERDPESEYSFEEADAATLAELGITAEAESGAQAEEKPKRTRRTRSTAKKATAADTAEAESGAEAEEKPKRTRSTRSTAKKATAADTAEEKPKRTRSTRSTAKKATAADTAEEKPKRTRSTRSTAKKATAADTAEEKPKRTRSTRSTAKKATAADTAEAESGAEATGEAAGGEGIWQRFRSGRTGAR